MQTEFLAVVDENDQVVQHLPRPQVHAQQLRHRAVHILIFNHSQQLFLQKRSMLKDLNKGLWDTSAAGHVDAGEDYDSTAPRELQEELGVTTELTALFKLSPTPSLGMEFIQVYRGQHDGPFQFSAEEIDDGAWFEQELIDERVNNNDPSLTETFKVIWQQYRQLP